MSTLKDESSQSESGESVSSSDDESPEDEKQDTSAAKIKNPEKEKPAVSNADNTEIHPLTFVCNTLTDFHGEEDGDLSFTKGEMLTVVGIRRDGWWKAENSEGGRGLVPSTFLKVPEHMQTLIESIVQSQSSDTTKLWSHLRSSLRQAHVLDTALYGFGAYPVGFRNSILADFLEKDKIYTAEAFLTPKLSDSGLSFKDLHWEETSASLKPKVTVIQKFIHLVALRQILPPPSGYHVTSRHLRMCLHDGNKVLSNIHTVKAKWDRKTPKIWAFAGKVSVDGSCSEEGQIFIRSDKSFATLGILFELCLSFKKDNSEIDEMSCGWAFMRLLNDSGVPVRSRTNILKVHDSIPFASHMDSTSATNVGSLKKFMARTKLPRMVVSISDPKRSSTQHICYLPSTLIGPVSCISLFALYRKIISDDLLERESFDSADLIQSPFLSNFPRVFNEPDLVDVLRKLWSERLKNDKSNNLKKEHFKKKEFRSLFMETIFLFLSCCSLPQYSVGNSTNEQVRKAEIARILQIINEHGYGAAAFSAEIEFKPLSIKHLTTCIL